MDARSHKLIARLGEEHVLPAGGYEYLVAHLDEELASEAAGRAVSVRKAMHPRRH